MKKQTIKSTIFLSVLLVAVALAFHIKVLTTPLISPIPKNFTIIKEVYTTPDTPEKYIKHIFGKDADKAFRLLAYENANLKADAVNVNNDKVRSRDYGVFQINEYWQKVQPKFLLNWKV